MDRRERYIAKELLHGLGVWYAHQAHEIYRVAHHQREGLTDKEFGFLMKRYEMAHLEMRKISTLAERLKR